MDLVSIAAPSLPGNGPTTSVTPPSLSADGRYVAFVSSAGNLVAGDRNGLQDVFVRDMQTGTTEIVSSADGTGSANGFSSDATITPDGRYVIFASDATNLTADATPGVYLRDLVTDQLTFLAAGNLPTISANGRYVAFSAADGFIAGDNNQAVDVFVLDRQTTAITLVSAAANGTPASSFATTADAVISGDGAFVTFSSDATNLIAGDNKAVFDIFRKNVSTGEISLVSSDGNGGAGNFNSRYASISSNGRYVAFVSNASNFVSGDSNFADVFVKDLLTGSIVRASSANDGTASNGQNYSRPVLSGDGRFLAFQADANNLVPGDTNGASDAFLKDMLLQTITRVSLNGAGGEAAGSSVSPAVNATGRYVAFYSTAANLVSGDTNSYPDLFWKDLQNSEVRLASANFDAAGRFSGNGNSAGVATASADGRYIAFSSAATDLAGGDANGNITDIFIHDTLNHTLRLVSSDTNGVQGNGASSNPFLSANGRYLTFTSTSSNLTAGDTNGLADIFLKDLVTGATSQASLSAGNVQGNFAADQSSVSDDGRYVVFQSQSSSLVGGDTNGVSDIFLKDFQTGVLSRVSTNASGQQAAGESAAPSLSSDGRVLAFHSYAENLVSGDSNGVADVFVKDLVNGGVTRVNVTAAGVAGNGNSLFPRLTRDGRYVGFQSSSTNFVTGDNNSATDAFVKDLATGSLVRVSLSAAGVQGNFDSASPLVSADGRYAVFSSLASNLVTGDTNGVSDVFVKDLQTAAVTRLSVSGAGVQGNGPSDSPFFAPDGSFVTFVSAAENLSVYDGQGLRDVFRATLTATGNLTLQVPATSVAENAGSISGTATRTGSLTAALVINLASSNAAVATVPATVTIPAGQAQATFTITIVGPSSTAITASAAGFVTASQTLTVFAVNNAPSFTIAANPPVINPNAGLQRVANFATAISAGPPDEAGQALNFTVAPLNSAGGLTFSGAPAINAATGELTYAATAGTSGTATFRAVLIDNGGTANGGRNTSTPIDFTITVTSGPLPFISGVPVNQVLRPNETTGVLTFTIGDDTTLPGNLIVTAASNTPGLIPSGGITLGGAGAQRTISIRPAADQTGGPAVITIQVRDAQANVTSAQFTVTVIPFVFGDISPDGVVDPQDVAFVSYYYSLYGPGDMTRLPQGPAQRADVNGDAVFDAQDVLFVVDAFNRHIADGESSSAAEGSEGESGSSTTAESHDAALLEVLGPEAS